MGALLVWCTNFFTSETSQGATSSPSLSVHYLDSTNANNPVPLYQVDGGAHGIGLFNLVDNCPGDGSPVDYVFKLSNNGTAPLNAVGGTPITVSVINRDPFLHGTAIDDFTATLIASPTFPVAAGDFTTCTVRLNYNANGGNNAPNDCGMGWVTPLPTSGEMGSVRIRLAIRTDDPSLGSYSPELTIWGAS